MSVSHSPATGQLDMLVFDMNEQKPALLLQDFVNTLDIECDDDEIATPEKLSAWLRQRGLLTATPLPTSTTMGDGVTVATAAGLREGLRAAMLGHHGPDAVEPPPELDEALARLPLRLAFSSGRPMLVPVRGGIEGGLARIAAAVMACLADGSWARLKVCQEDTCRWAFLDTSKNHSRAWCSMRVCGNRTKTRAYRARGRPDTGSLTGA
jgi:predicted RNA-binding Zn ribbon-like protein